MTTTGETKPKRVRKKKDPTPKVVVKATTKEITEEAEKAKPVSVTFNLRDNLVRQPRWDYLPLDLRDSVNRVLEAKSVDDLNGIEVQTMVDAHDLMVSKQPGVVREVEKLLTQIRSISPVVGPGQDFI